MIFGKFIFLFSERSGRESSQKVDHKSELKKKDL